MSRSKKLFAPRKTLKGRPKSQMAKRWRIALWAILLAVLERGKIFYMFLNVLSPTNHAIMQGPRITKRMFCFMVSIKKTGNIVFCEPYALLTLIMDNIRWRILSATTQVFPYVLVDRLMEILRQSRWCSNRIWLISAFISMAFLILTAVSLTLQNFWIFLSRVGWSVTVDQRKITWSLKSVAWRNGKP